MYSVLFSLNLSQADLRPDMSTHIFSFKGADSLWFCCNESILFFPWFVQESELIREWIIKDLRRQWVISAFRDISVFQRDPSFYHPWDLTTAKQQKPSPNQQNKVSFFHLSGLKAPPFAITEAIKNCYLPVFDGATPFKHCSSADDSLTSNIRSFRIHLGA